MFLSVIVTQNQPRAANVLTGTVRLTLTYLQGVKKKKQSTHKILGNLYIILHQRAYC